MARRADRPNIKGKPLGQQEAVPGGLAHAPEEGGRLPPETWGHPVV
ncbi:hypothetical protein D187_009208 [Cystobacter fuscus DSM 2262]|uniref:Uncharacterized protein n=1 Tax=Cystobacter fuscus (strain ATCC 25194 / DSM 2262 / NBRC 100088 / M29) TaxID=1242864 RepID=S9P021_CYSF2|nr:hypothetical protein D187_009208 [Cystobacter fuscus DSM 2262]